MNWGPLLILAALAGALAVLWFIGLLRLNRRAPRPPSPKKSEP